MFERLKYWWETWYNREFKYDTSTGNGYAFMSYDPFKDRITIRLSRFGYVEGYSYMSRQEFGEIKKC